jgi:hypothetical protein
MTKPTPEYTFKGVTNLGASKKDDTTHIAYIGVKYGSRKFQVVAERKLKPAAPGKRRTESYFVAEAFRYDRSYKRIVFETQPSIIKACIEYLRSSIKPTSDKFTRRVTMRQENGDDGYCWAVRVDGRVKWDSMQRSEASWRRDTEIRLLREADAKINAV